MANHQNSFWQMQQPASKKAVKIRLKHFIIDNIEVLVRGSAGGFPPLPISVCEPAPMTAHLCIDSNSTEYFRRYKTDLPLSKDAIALPTLDYASILQATELTVLQARALNLKKKRPMFPRLHLSFGLGSSLLFAPPIDLKGVVGLPPALWDQLRALQTPAAQNKNLSAEQTKQLDDLKHILGIISAIRCGIPPQHTAYIKNAVRNLSNTPRTKPVLGPN